VDDGGGSTADGRDNIRTRVAARVVASRVARWRIARAALKLDISANNLRRCGIAAAARQRARAAAR